MFLKKRNKIASILISADELAFLSYKRTKKGLQYMYSVVQIESRLGINPHIAGDWLIRALAEFDDKVDAPSDLNSIIDKVCGQLNCRSWNALVEKYDLIDVEALEEKSVKFIPNIKVKSGRQKCYEPNLEESFSLSWDQQSIGKALLQLANAER